MTSSGSLGWMVPLLSSSTEWWIFPLCSETCTHSVQLWSVLDYVLTCPLSLRQVPFLDKAVVCPLSTTTSRYAQCKLCRRRGFHSAVLGWSSTCPLVCKRQGSGQTVEKTVVPQLHSSDKVVTVLVVRVVQILRCKCGGDSRLPQLQLLRIPSRFRACSWTRSLTYLCCATTGAWSLAAENCGFSAVAVHRQGVDVPAIMQRRVSQWEVPQTQFIA